jgi:predicted transcriptional regulator
MTMEEIYEEHNVGTQFIKKNYKTTLIQMEDDGLIGCDRPAHTRRPGTFADDISVTFP